MDGVLWQTGSPPELFTGFGRSAYFSGQSALETHPPFEAFDRVRLVASWFRHHAEELEQVLSPSEATTRCQDLA